MSLFLIDVNCKKSFLCCYKRAECEPSQLGRTESNEAENKAAENHSTLMTIIWFSQLFFFIFFDISGHFEQIKKFEKKILKNFEVPKKIEPKKKVTYSMCFFHVSSHGEHFSPWNFLSHFWNIFFLISLILGFWGVNYWGWTGQFWSIRPKNTDLFSLETPLWPTKFVYRLLSWLERNGCPKTTTYTVFATFKTFLEKKRHMVSKFWWRQKVFNFWSSFWKKNKKTTKFSWDNRAFMSRPWPGPMRIKNCT